MKALKRALYFRRSAAAWLAGSAGAMAAGIGAAAMVGWHFQWRALVQLGGGDLPVIAYFTALCLVLNGAGLLAHACGGPRLVTVAGGALAAALGWGWALENVLGWRLGLAALEGVFPTMPGLPPIHPSPAAAVCLGLYGVAITTLGLGGRPGAARLVVWVCVAMAVAPCAMVIGGYATGFLSLADTASPHGMAMNTLVAMFLLEGGLVAALSLDGRMLADDPLLPVPVCLAGVAAAGLFWLALNTDEHAALQAEVRAVLRPMADNALLHLSTPIHALERMQRRWEMRGGTPYEEWREDADAHVATMPAFGAIAWATPAGRIAWCRPEAAAGLHVGRDIRDDTRWDATAALDRAEREGGTVVSPAIALRQGGSGFLVYLPLRAKGAFQGWLIGIIRIDTLLEFMDQSGALHEETISIYEGGRLIFGPEPRPAPWAGLAELTRDFHGQPWRFVVVAQPAAATGHDLPTVTLVLGLVLAAMATAGTRAYQQIAWKNRTIRAANAQLERYANEDYLTGLLNRRNFDEMLAMEWRRAQRGRLALAVIMADVDYFKKYNDRYGHQAGDECLRRVGAVFRSAQRRASDHLGRYGGEEFCAVLAETDAAGARTFAEGLRAAVRAMGLPHADNPPGCVTASLGVAAVDFSRESVPETFTEKDLVARADAALYAAKEAGRNTVR